jgi:hypothetical protein
MKALAHTEEHSCVRFEFLTSVKIVMYFLCAVTPCRLVDTYQRFWERTVSIFNLEHLDSIFLWNVNIYIWICTASQPRKHNPQRRENLQLTSLCFSLLIFTYQSTRRHKTAKHYGREHMDVNESRRMRGSICLQGLWTRSIEFKTDFIGQLPSIRTVYVHISNPVCNSMTPVIEIHS